MRAILGCVACVILTCAAAVGDSATKGGTVLKPGESRDGFSLTTEGTILFGGEVIAQPTENFFPETVTLQVDSVSPAKRYAFVLLWDEELLGVEGYIIDVKLKFPVADLATSIGVTRDIPGKPPLVLKPGIQRGIAWSPEETLAVFLTRSDRVVDLGVVDLATGKVNRVPVESAFPGLAADAAFPQLATLKWMSPHSFRIDSEVRCLPGPDPACKEKQGSFLKTATLEVDAVALTVKPVP